jgi:multicomponent K+:H+ antiporter subunit C
LFIFSMGRLGLAIGKEPVLQPGLPQDLAHYADPMPQALVLTAIVIGFAMTALFLVVLLASRGMAGTDHVDGTHAEDAGDCMTPGLVPRRPSTLHPSQGQGTPQPSPSGLASEGASHERHPGGARASH